MTPMRRVQVAFSEFLIAWMTDKKNLSPSPDDVRNLGMAFFGGFLAGAKVGVGTDGAPVVEAAYTLANDFACGKDVLKIEVLLKEPDPSGN